MQDSFYRKDFDATTTIVESRFRTMPDGRRCFFIIIDAVGGMYTGEYAGTLSDAVKFTESKLKKINNKQN